MAHEQATLIRVFGAEKDLGGNPCPVVLDAQGWTDEQMQSVAKGYGHESAFILPASEPSGADFEFRFWVPHHEMEMCGHATLASMWLLAKTGKVQPGQIKISTQSGLVLGHISRHKDDSNDFRVELLQSPAEIHCVPKTNDQALLRVLGIHQNSVTKWPLRNASTARFKTLVPLVNKDLLDALEPDFDNMEAICTALQSTGLYPYAVENADHRHVHARQFPRSSGYHEDPATGIAAAALAFSLLEQGTWKAEDQSLMIFQGYAIKKPSRISIRFEVEGLAVLGCWLGGRVELMNANS